MSATISITVEQLEALAASITADAEQQRERLLRIIRAYVRILAVREPDEFGRQMTVYADTDGSWDGSYPPKQRWKQPTGPAAIRVRDLDFDSRATSGGFYHSLAYFTSSPELCIDADGQWWAGELTGTGEFGQFAAYPGECNVDCEINYSEISDDDVPTDVLIDAEEQLRGLAFPAATARQAAEQPVS
jgi:hypothetical protein